MVTTNVILDFISVITSLAGYLGTYQVLLWSYAANSVHDTETGSFKQTLSEEIPKRLEKEAEDEVRSACSY